MSKRGLAIITVIGLLVCCCNSHKQKVQEEYTELGRLEILPKISLLDFELKGDVKSISEYTYNAILRFGEYEKVEPCLSLTETIFNDKGIIFETNLYIQNSSPYDPMVLKRKAKYLYDVNNHLEKIETYANSGELIGKEIYRYDENNNCVERTQYKSDGALSEQRFCNYDTKGNLTTIENYYNNKLTFSTKFVYDNRGRIIESTNAVSNIPETGYYSTSYMYDKLNNMTEEVNYNSKGWILDKTFYRYRGNREIEMIEFDPVDLSITSTNYVKSGKVITFFEKSDESVESRTYTYNNKHELIEDKYDDGGYQIFKYDDKSNWNYSLVVTKVVNEEGEIVGTEAEITIRETAYWN